MKRPWMPLYIADYLADTAHLSAAQHGAYMLLIMHYWANEGLPSDEESIRRITRLSNRQWSQSCDLLKSLFSEDWRHKRIDEELAKSIEKSRVNSANAKRRHIERKQVADVSHDRTHQRSDTQSQSQLERKEDKIGADAPDAGYAFNGGVIKLRRKSFDDWVKAYPNLDLLAELTARDAWLSSGSATHDDRRRWFVSTSQHLANRNRDAKVKLAGAQARASPRTPEAERLYREGFV
jgi:uncharacterized protein YdaU (DUF1376 family)